MRRAPVTRKFAFVSLVLVGDVLAIASYFSPLLRLYLSGGERPGEREYTLSMLISPDGHMNGSVLIGIFVPIGVMALCSLLFVALPTSLSRTILGYAAGMIAI